MNAPILPPSAQAAQRDGWQARLALRFAPRTTRTQMVERSRQGPLSVQRGFYPEGELCHSYILHPPGGVVGGDQIDITCQLDPQAKALVTTPGATKFYRSLGALASQTQTLRVAPGASLEYLPQESIYFSGAQVRMDTQIELSESSHLIAWEMHCAGRPVMNEGFEQGSVFARLQVRLNSQLIYADHARLGARFNQASHRNFAMQSTWIGAWADSDDLQCARDCLARHRITAAATLVDGLLVVRALTHSTDQVLPVWIDLWRALRPSLIGRTACPPRIWNT